MTAFKLGLAMAVLLSAVSTASVLVKQPRLDSDRKALIYDALYETQTGANFTNALEDTLAGRGYIVEVYQGEEATVNLLQTLHGDYSLIVFRVHSGVFDEEVWLFTGEEFDASKHVGMQLVNEVHVNSHDDGPRYLF